MNLHGIVSGAISAVNPRIMVAVSVNTGNTIDDAGKPTPTFAAPVTVPGQVQPLQYRDMQQMDALNVQGTRRAIYLYGRVDGLIRSENKGGDLIEIAAPGDNAIGRFVIGVSHIGTGVNAGIWLVAVIAEQWPDWVKALCTLQNR